MIQVPVIDVPSQTFAAQLGGQSFQLNVYQNAWAPDATNRPFLYMDVLINNVLVVGGAACENLNRIVRDLYLGVVGDFTWFDTQGASDPTTPGLGSRYQLIYMEASDLGARG